jgi:hypothetical protein
MVTKREFMSVWPLRSGMAFVWMYRALVIVSLFLAAKAEVASEAGSAYKEIISQEDGTITTKVEYGPALSILVSARINTTILIRYMKDTGSIICAAHNRESELPCADPMTS